MFSQLKGREHALCITYETVMSSLPSQCTTDVPHLLHDLMLPSENGISVKVDIAVVAVSRYNADGDDTVYLWRKSRLDALF